MQMGIILYRGSLHRIKVIISVQFSRISTQKKKKKLYITSVDYHSKYNNALLSRWHEFGLESWTVHVMQGV